MEDVSGDGYKNHADINECDRPSDYPCHGICQDTDGSYDCKCHRGYQNSGDPKEQPCSPKFPLAAQIALGILQIDLHSYLLFFFTKNIT